MEDYEIEVFFDGDCPLCRREINFCKRLDRKKRVRFTDIAAKDFDSTRYSVDYDRLMQTIHGRLPSGEWVEGVEVFRRLYQALGFGWLVALTRIPGIDRMLDWAYAGFAARRLRWTGRCDAQKGVCT